MIIRGLRMPAHETILSKQEKKWISERRPSNPSTFMIRIHYSSFYYRCVIGAYGIQNGLCFGIDNVPYLPQT